MEVKGKKILIFGVARSGVGAANLLTRLGAEVTVTDKKSKEELREFIERLLPPVRLSLGGHPEEIFKDVDLIVISPGVSLDISPLQKAREAGVKIIGEFELAYQINSKFKIQNLKSPEFLAVTGTNGKSTTTTLLDLMLKSGDFRTILGGNIGNALTEEIYKRIGESENRRIGEITVSPCHRFTVSDSEIAYIVAEVSSFQLESIDAFRPRGAAILNITPDHLDRYHSMAEYRDAKARIFLNQQGEDFLVLNADDPEINEIGNKKLEVRSVKPQILFFSRKKEVKGVYFKNGIVYCNLPDLSLPTSHFPLIRVDEIKIKGVHNLENAMAASAMALLANCPVEAVINTLKEFPGLEHRLEFVREFKKVSYINDSKGTNVGAVLKSLESFTEPVILIAGGRDKAGDFSVLRSLIKNRVKTLVLIGEAREKIKKALGDLTETIFADDLTMAVMLSRESASEGDVVLLSPACASFDMFKNFEDRGEQFKKIVRDMV